MTRIISVVIPSGDTSRGSNLERLLQDLKDQSFPPDEVEVVRGERPNGHARNVGVSRVSGDVLVFLDDDVRLGTPEILRAFAELLSADPTLGMLGTSQVLPKDSTRFQLRCAEQISRSASEVVQQLTESDMVTTQCCAMRRDVLEQVGGFHDKIIRGVDPELRHRVRQAGYRIAVIPHAWHYHPMPTTLRALLRMAWRNGTASAYARKHFPETVLFNPEGHVGDFQAQVPLWRRALGAGGRIAGDLFSGKWYGLLYNATYAAGAAIGTSKP
jgi:glycosyltransferase involved in cell wall biosynthesis